MIQLLMTILRAIWKFVSFLFVPQQGKHITEQAQSYDNK